MHERDLIRRIVGANPALRASRVPVLVPPGDDMALLELASRRLLVAADQVIERRHFVPGTPMRAVARKAVLRNMSDIAAMAGVPVACVATVVLPADIPDEAIVTLYEALREFAAENGCPLVGGDTGVADDPSAPLVVSVTVLAEPGPTGRVVERRGACAGDSLCVTGALGGSFAAGGGGRHLAPSSRVVHALELVRLLGDRLHAMIDLSDGLGRDAAHLARAARLDVEVDIAHVPCAPGVDWRGALSDGEDYELAFACEGEPPSNLCGVPVTVIGRFVADASAGRSPAASAHTGEVVTEGAPRMTGARGSEAAPGGRVWIQVKGARVDAASMGWEHSTRPGASEPRP